MFSSKLLDRFLPIETLMKNMSQIEVSNQEYISLCQDDKFWLQKLANYYPKEYYLLMDYELEIERKQKRNPLNFNSKYECFKWCFEQSFCIKEHNKKRDFRFIEKEKYPEFWWVCQIYYLRLKEHNLPEVKSWREQHLYYLGEGNSEISMARHVDGKTSLYIACEDGQLETVEWLVKNGADIETGEFNTESLRLGCIPTIPPLYVACEQNRVDIAKFLIENKANVDGQWYSKDGSKKALFVACQRGNVEIVKLLLKNGANVEGGYFGRNYDSESPLYAACRAGHVKIVKLLLENGADLNRGIVQHSNSNKDQHIAPHERKRRHITPLERVESMKSSPVKTRIKALLNQYVHKQEIKKELEKVLSEKGCLEKHPLTVGVELFKWYADQALLSRHFFHYKNIVKNITQELMQISEENFDVNVFTKTIEDAFKSQADADRNSFFSFWKTPADHRLLREDGHLKTIEDLIKTTIAYHATTQSKGLRIKG